MVYFCPILRFSSSQYMPHKKWIPQTLFPETVTNQLSSPTLGRVWSSYFESISFKLNKNSWTYILFFDLQVNLSLNSFVPANGCKRHRNFYSSIRVQHCTDNSNLFKFTTHSVNNDLFPFIFFINEIFIWIIRKCLWHCWDKSLMTRLYINPVHSNCYRARSSCFSTSTSNENHLDPPGLNLSIAIHLVFFSPTQ